MTDPPVERLRIEALADHHDRVGFSCGVEALDSYFRQRAGQDTRRRLASCFVLIGDHRATALGFYTLAAASIVMTDLPAATSRRLPRYPAAPATLLGRLAVDSRHRNKGLGELLLLDAFNRTLRSEIATFAMIVDAKDASSAAFYATYGFRPLTDAGRRLFIPMDEVAKILG